MRFVDAKTAAITKRKAVEQEIGLLQQSENPTYTAEAEQKRKKELEPLKHVRISKDLMPRRQSLLAVVKNIPGVKYAYTRNAIIHAITKGDKIKVFLPIDLYKLYVKEIPVDDLKIPQAVKEVGGGRTISYYKS